MWDLVWFVFSIDLDEVEEFMRWVFAEDSAALGGSVKGAVSDVTLLVGGGVFFALVVLGAEVGQLIDFIRGMLM